MTQSEFFSIMGYTQFNSIEIASNAYQSFKNTNEILISMKRIENKYKTSGALIQKCHLFSNLNNTSTNEIASHFKLVKWSKGSQIDHETIAGNFLF